MHCGWKRRQICSGVSLGLAALISSAALGLMRRSSCMPSRVGTRKVLGGMVAGIAPWAAISSFTRWKVSLAVWLILRLRSVVSLMPGTCNKMRSSPWRTMVGSIVPVSSTRRRRISIDWSTTSFFLRNRSWSE